ncbi:RNA polymerase sigma factor [Sanyastnella coralliicola]|uniref:RNA polymerase sigma factor n=1 Tax=Sanyastnella coralliicola TaxID=3069118 RepID=UPI0027B94665|nr:sigma-70 family RNA polymerase sigma factor [Longitalea sp. SCSIO 12813]
MTERSKRELSQLIFRIQEGDTDAFGELYRDYSATLYGVSLKILGSEDQAEDVLQDAFIKIWKNIKKFNPQKGSIFTWMLNITRNTAIDRLRKSKNLQKAKIQTHAENVDYPARVRSSQNTDVIGLNDEVNKLAPEHRQMIEFIYFRGYTQQEVSDELVIPLGTVKTRVRKAVIELRKVFTTLFFWM